MLNRLLILFLLFWFTTCGFAAEVPIYDFSIKSYSQNVNDYLSPDSPDYTASVLKPEYQKAQRERFYMHYYESSTEKGLSPWSGNMVKATIPIVKNMELEILNGFDNRNNADLNRHYGENFKEHDVAWFVRIKNNMNFEALDNMSYNPNHRAIAVANTVARALPDGAPDFYHFSLPGEGFPFDNLQESAIWMGTPLYVLSVSQDKAWSLVLTPDEYFAWVKSTDIAYVSGAFMHQWQRAAQKGMVAITKTEASVFNREHNFQFSAYIGAVFPLDGRDDKQISFLTPIKNAQQYAEITTSYVTADAADLMPLAASPQNMARLLKQLQNRPYGWGGLFFFNDCSQELKSLFTPFAIWLPRNSGAQAKVGAPIDLSTASVDERISALKAQGHPLMTLIYINGHVMLYLGTKEINNTPSAITYQNLWGMAPINKERRYVVGQSLFFPLLKSYSEAPEVSSLADKERFVLVHLDEINDEDSAPEKSIRNFALPDMPKLGS